MWNLILASILILTCALDASEPNNIRASAARLQPERELVATFHNLEDTDWYQFTVSSGAYTIDVNQLSLGTDPFIWLYNASGTKLASADDVDHAACLAGDIQACAARITIRLDVGTYFLLIVNLGRNGACPTYHVKLYSNSISIPLFR